jgi:polysaccharide export outer membrane protein
MRILPALILLSSILVSVPAAAQEARQSSQAVLTPGDSVRIVVWRKPEFSGDFVIAPDGTISHPLFRVVKVGGVPYATAEANLRKFLGQFEANPEFVMEPLVRVAVSGEVTRPQVFAVRPETTIGEAVARAGGANENGASNRVRVLRFEGASQQELVVDLNDPTTGSGTIPVRSGDQIVVDRKRSFFRDFLVPALGIVGSIASIALLIDRANNN